ncbi:RICIN domain-containing protein [Luteolibacter flavescens]|uniref:RICIN domain-containing protein n=1 Tax=Luteolibacter flavescens TaxID=1859460 RepID=A0ABT3FRG0_9BACT|nr:RICIN domain-containing protein [Luteolibacter flavescens]MCW1885550.1 RICIN domain-containing protein [Luteolibacter flavescens]
MKSNSTNRIPGGTASSGGWLLLSFAVLSSASAWAQVANGTYKIVARHSGQALEANGTGSQSTLKQLPYEGRASQQWTLTSLGGGQYQIMGVQSGLYAQVTGSSQANDAEVRLYPWVNQNNFKVTLEATEDGYYRIKFVHSNKGLAVYRGVGPLLDSSYNYGFKAVQRDSGGLLDDQWKFLPTGHVANAGNPFEMIVLPDTQKYTNEWNGGTHEMFYGQTAWIANNRTTRNIKYVAHVGDIVDNQNVPAQWVVADTAMSTLDDTVPYGVVPGNHDYNWWETVPVTQSYHQIFGASRWAGKSYYGGSFGALSNENHFDLITANGIDFVIIYLCWRDKDNPNQAEYDWADSILKAYPDRKGILVSHEIINPHRSWGWNGQQMYDTVKGNPNLFLTLCGHYGGEAIRYDRFGNNIVHSVLADYQGDVNGGNGKLRVMKFVPAENIIRIETYSTHTNQWYTNSGAQISIPFEMGIVNGGIYELEPLCAPGSRMEVRSGNSANSSNVSLWTDNNSNPQRWRVELQTDGSYELIPQHATGMRLNVASAGTSNGTNVDIYADQNSNSQRFVLQSQSDGWYEIAPKHAPAMRLDVQGGLSANNTNIRLYTDNNSAAQRWKLIKQP